MSFPSVRLSPCLYFLHIFLFSCFSLSSYKFTILIFFPFIATSSLCTIPSLITLSSISPFVLSSVLFLYLYALLQHILWELFAPYLTTTIQTIFHLCIPKKALAKISTKYFQNRIIMFCLELWFSVEKYSFQQREQYFQTELWNYSSTGDSYFQIRTTKMVPWIFYFLI